MFKKSVFEATTKGFDSLVESPLDVFLVLSINQHAANRERGERKRGREEGCTDNTKNIVNNTGYDLWLNLIWLQCYLVLHNVTVFSPKSEDFRLASSVVWIHG